MTRGDFVAESPRFSERVEQATLQTILGSLYLNTHFVSVALEKYVSHLLLERSSISRPFRPLIVFYNATYRPTIVETETERKLFIDCYCRVYLFLYLILFLDLV